MLWDYLCLGVQVIACVSLSRIDERYWLRYRKAQTLYELVNCTAAVRNEFSQRSACVCAPRRKLTFTGGSKEVK
jgi:hypothetical protein